MIVSGDVQAGPRLAETLEGLVDPLQDAVLGLGMVTLAYLPVVFAVLTWRLTPGRLAPGRRPGAAMRRGPARAPPRRPARAGRLGLEHRPDRPRSGGRADDARGRRRALTAGRSRRCPDPVPLGRARTEPTLTTRPCQHRRRPTRSGRSPPRQPAPASPEPAPPSRRRRDARPTRRRPVDRGRRWLGLSVPVHRQRRPPGHSRHRLQRALPAAAGRRACPPARPRLRRAEEGRRQHRLRLGADASSTRCCSIQPSVTASASRRRSSSIPKRTMPIRPSASGSPPTCWPGSPCTATTRPSGCGRSATRCSTNWSIRPGCRSDPTRPGSAEPVTSRLSTSS